MIVGMHQPNFFPYLGFFHKMVRCDVFVILDKVQMEWGRTQRNRIMARDGTPQWIRIPVARKYKFRKINEVKIDNETHWGIRLLDQFSVYKDTAYFEEISDIFDDLLSKDWEFLHEINYSIIEKLVDMLGINVKMIKMPSTYDRSTTATQKLVDICNDLGADVYLSGVGGKNYIDSTLFQENDIELRYQEYQPVVYKQCHSKVFQPNLSVIDSIMNVGADAVKKLIN